MALLDKRLTLYERNDKAELIPQIRPLYLNKKDAKDFPELVGTEVSIIPLTRGEIKELFGLTGKTTDAIESENRDNDAEIVLSKCKVPSYTKEDLVAIKPVVIRSIVATILNESGVKVEEDTGRKKVNEDADEFGKN